MNKKEIEKLALEYDRNLSSHPMSAGELRKDLTEFAIQVVKKLNIPVVRLSCFKEVLDMYNAIGDDSDFYKWLHDKVHEA